MLDIHIPAHIFGGKTANNEWLSLYTLYFLQSTNCKYMWRFIFWVGKQVPATGQVFTPHISCNLLVDGIYLASYFGWKNRYLQPGRPEIYNRLYISDGKIGICNWPNLKYMLDFIFRLVNHIFIINQNADSSPTS